MPLTQAQINAGTGSQADQRIYDRQHGGGLPAGWNVPYGEGAGEAGANYSAWRGLPPLPASTIQQTFSPEELASFDYATLFGNVTPQARVNAGMPYAPTNAAPAANPGTGAPKPQGPTSTPQQAGENNSLQPGWSGGSMEPGQSMQESGFQSKVLDTRPATDPLNQAAAGTLAGADQGLPPPPTERRAMATPYTETPGEVQAAGGTQKAAAADTGFIVNYKGQQYTVDKQKPANFAQWDPARQQQWLTEHSVATPGGQTGGDAPQAAQPPKDNWGYNIAGQPPAGPISGYEQALLGTEQAGRALSAQLQSQGQTYAGRVAYILTQLVYGDTNTNTPGLTQFLSSGGAIGPNHQQFIAKATEMEKYLNSIGINWHPVSDAIAQAQQGGGGGGGGGGGDGGTGDGGTGDGGAGGGDGGTGGYPADPGSNTDISPIDMDSAMRILNGIVGGGMNDPKYRPFLITMAYAIAQQRQADANKQQGVNIYSDAIENVRTSPTRMGTDAIMSGILANPDPTPWDLVRDQTIADQHRAATAAGTQYQKSAVRSLGTAGASAAPGVMADFLRQSDNETSRRLGDLEVRKAQEGRDAAYRALSAGQSYEGSTTGADAERARALAAMIAGRPDVGPNPIEGASDAWVNSNAFNMAMNQDSGGGLGWETALGAIPALFKPGASGEAGSSAAGGFVNLLATLGPMLGI